MTIEDYRAAVRPKVQGTQHLHELMPKNLDFFICLSSVGGIVGSRGQGNYNAGKRGLVDLSSFRKLVLIITQEMPTKTLSSTIAVLKASKARASMLASS